MRIKTRKSFSPQRIFIGLLGGLLFLAGTAFASSGSTKVMVTPLEGAVGVPMEKHLQEVLQELGAEKGPVLLVLQLNTPGGLVSVMRGMTGAIMQAPFPVVVWVSPRGAQAGSAGAFFLESATVAAMAPGTNVGAAHPVTSGGKDVPSETMNEKITNDLAAYMRSLAQHRERNGVVAERMVRYSIALSAQEALEEGVADVLAEDLESLLAALEGRHVMVQGKEAVLDLGDYEVLQRPLSLRLQLLSLVARPDMAYLLILGGLYAVIFELFSPGGFVLGVSGGVLLLLGSLGLRMLPFNWAGIALLVGGVGVMVLDLLVGGLGILSLLGTAALVVGGLVIFRTPPGEMLDFSFSLMFGGVLVLTAFFLFVLMALWRTRKNPVQMGFEGLRGKKAKVVKPLAPEGLVLCHGEYWKARSISGETLVSGTIVECVHAEGLLLTVKALSAPESGRF